MTTNLLRLSITTLAFAFASFASVSAADSDNPKDALESTIHELLDVLHADNGSLSFTDKREQIVSILDESFSFDVIIQRALGRNWAKLDSDQKRQVTLLITDLVLKTYTRELQNGPRPTLSFSEPEALSKSKIEIDSKVKVNGSDVNLTYRLANIKDRGWQVYDVLVENVSMVSNYRKQFDEHFQKKTAQDLIELLRNKLNKVHS